MSKMSDLEREPDYVSSCCTAGSLGNIHEFDGEHYGLCGKCKEHTDFIDINKENNPEPEHNDIYLQLTHEHKRQTANWNSIIDIIKEIHFKKYNQKEIGEIIDEVVSSSWEQYKAFDEEKK
tara:strand:- start:237 stop:599 length:363 start_codon:yes stop_codon:yes gene_type:complete